MAKMTGKQAVMEMLVAEGVEYVFGNPGTSETPFMDALEDYPQLQYILALQEGSVIGMADGYARASGKPGFANVHIAAGLANAISMLYDAYRGGTSLVVTAGQSDTRMLMQHPTLSADLVEMTKQFTKWSVEVHHTEDIPMVMRRAFKVAKEPPTAPVFVSLPWNVLDETADVEIVPSPQKLYRPYPDPEAISKAVELLTRAKNPLLVIGDRISQSQAVEEMVNVAELLGVKVYTAARSEVNFPTDHPLSGGLLSLTAVQAKEMIRSSDLIFSVGSNLFTQFLYNPIEIPYEKTKIVHLDSSAWEIGRIYPAEVGIFCDLKPGLRELAKALDATLSSGAKEAAQTRMAKFAGEKKKAQERFESQAQASWDQVPISVPRLMLELRECLPEKTVIVDESITSGAA
ncbi:MAG: thiamine pyrophosphate-binding protein, partial [Candidatus Tectomicrobia bacterium]|nr:thiamine pyrophosphate-binding protein [Candidatus Tectomicrobia bacterium]